MRVRAAIPKATPKRNPFGAAFRGLIWGGVILAGLYFSQDHLQPWKERVQHWIAQAQGKAAKSTPVSSAPPVAAAAPKEGAGKKKAGKKDIADASASSSKGGSVTQSDAEKARAAQPAAAVETAGADAAVETPAAAPKSVLVLTKPADVQLAFGKVVLQPGTQLKFVASEGSNVRVLYGNDAVVLPASSTDYVAPSGAAAAPAKPAVSPNSLF